MRPLFKAAVQVSGHLGRYTIGRGKHFLDLFAFAYRMLSVLLHRPKEGRRLLNTVILEQIYFTAVQALPIIIPIALLLGSMLLIQFAKISPHYDLGKITVLLIVREFGPLITALVVILRSATAVTIETGYMTVLHEMESMEMAGIDPIHIYSIPRLLGITTAVLCLFLVFDLTAVLGGGFVVWTTTQYPMANFLGQIAKAVSGMDIVVGIIKGFLFGTAIAITSLYRGFTTSRQITAIPVSTSKAAVECLFYCLVLHVMVSVAFYS
ncbi:MAG: ABC transporter permease [Syntrophales bacterium]|nr:ABC transporter permease [Syntrophales bacterium]